MELIERLRRLGPEGAKLSHELRGGMAGAASTASRLEEPDATLAPRVLRLHHTSVIGEPTAGHVDVMGSAVEDKLALAMG